MGNRTIHAGLIAALLAAAPAFAVGRVADTGKPAPKERHWDPYAHSQPDQHRSEFERAEAFRKECERQREETCVKQLKLIKAEPLRDDLKAVAR